LRQIAASLAMVAALGCSKAVQTGARVSRADRYGLLADLVLFSSLEPGGRPFFLDRFETSQEDWRAYREAQGVAPRQVDTELGRYARLDASIPVTMVRLAQARSFAAWHFGRLPRYEEWYAASTGGGRYLMPWGNQIRPWANSLELKLGFLTPVGTFESGRSGDGPYDLVGNAAEWTESVNGARLSGLRGCRRVAGNPALGVWCRALLPTPAYWVLQGEDTLSDPVPRIVVGGFTRPMLSPAQKWELSGRAGRSSRVGLRVAADPQGLVLALSAEPEAPTPGQERALRRFLSRPEHRRVLREVYRRHPELLAAKGPLVAILLAELNQ